LELKLFFEHCSVWLFAKLDKLVLPTSAMLKRAKLLNFVLLAYVLA